MTRAPFVMAKAETAFSRNAEIYDTTIGWRFVNPLMKEQYGIDSMPETGRERGRGVPDQPRGPGRASRCASQQRAVAAQRAGTLAKRDRAGDVPQRKGDPMVVDTDEHPRPDTTLEALAKLRPSFGRTAP